MIVEQICSLIHSGFAIIGVGMNLTKSFCLAFSLTIYATYLNFSFSSVLEGLVPARGLFLPSLPLA